MLALQFEMGNSQPKKTFGFFLASVDDPDTNRWDEVGVSKNRDIPKWSGLYNCSQIGLLPKGNSSSKPSFFRGELLDFGGVKYS